MISIRFRSLQNVGEALTLLWRAPIWSDQTNNTWVEVEMFFYNFTDRKKPS
jgi:hypothetical protein